MTKLTREKAEAIVDGGIDIEEVLEKIKKGTIDKNEAIFTLSIQCSRNVADATEPEEIVSKEERRETLDKTLDLLDEIDELVADWGAHAETNAFRMISARMLTRRKMN
jgi:hypothetical protein